MKVRARHSFFDVKEQKGRKQYEVWEVDDSRASYLINIGYATEYVEEPKTQKKKD